MSQFDLCEPWKVESHPDGTQHNPKLVETDVLIAGSGPIGCAFARQIMDNTEDYETNILMIEVGAQDSPVIGRHHKNSIKYQKDIDAFVNVIKGALQPVSVPPVSTYMPTLGGDPWYPEEKKDSDSSHINHDQGLVSPFINLHQKPEKNLPGCAVTRTVGGMATHWTCACPRPHADERGFTPLERPDEFDELLGEAEKMLNVEVTTKAFEDSVRHNLVKGILQESYNNVADLPLAVRREEGSHYVTWSGSDTVLGDPGKWGERFELRSEHKLIGFIRKGTVDLTRLSKGTGEIEYAYVKDLRKNEYLKVKAMSYVVACGAVCTPQILWNSGFGDHGNKPIELPALGHYLTEQSLAFCQVVLKREIIEGLRSLDSKYLNNNRKLKIELKKAGDNGKDPIYIPRSDAEPQVTMKYTETTPWHAQIHRDAFSYGDVGYRVDPRLIVDLRFFGRQEVLEENYVTFSDEHTDAYLMPQATFHVTRSEKDREGDHRMMTQMCEVAAKLGAFLPGAYPQFMEPGLAQHITGTTRLGKSPKDSVADENSQVHGHPSLYVGGNNVIPSSTACNPTLTSVAYAIKAARHIAEKIKREKRVPEPGPGPQLPQQPQVPEKPQEPQEEGSQAPQQQTEDRH
ncbi:hypothetical protein OPQ81_005780 [Rhizoctonia solani]|nr:hypothetical protein OPQ81_005780 [Rhizoctonia solani]